MVCPVKGTRSPSSPAQGTVKTNLLSINDAAAAIGVTRRQLYRYIAADRVLSVQIGRRRFVPAQEVDAFSDRLRKELDQELARYEAAKAAREVA
jgi:excisionase family DNA binding protein